MNGFRSTFEVESVNLTNTFLGGYFVAMRQNIPSEFLKTYYAKEKDFKKSLKEIASILQRRLAQLGAQEGVRGRIIDMRVKRPGKLWKNARKANLTISEAFTGIEDLLGIRIVCNNLSDIESLVNMIRGANSFLTVQDVKDMVTSPTTSGYRAIHIRSQFLKTDTPIPCEIQIRTLSQDTWARLSRVDLYGRNVPSSIKKLARSLSTQLSTIDEISQLIRDELNQCPASADALTDSDRISPQILALLYREVYKEEIYEWIIADWVRALEDAEVENVGEVHALLDDNDLRNSLNTVANSIRGFPLENTEWVVYSALVVSEVTRSRGIREIRKDIQSKWDEIVVTARNEALSEMPETLEEFIEILNSGDIPTEALKELKGIQDCVRCGEDILIPSTAAEAVLYYYGNPDTDTDIEMLLEEAANSPHYYGPGIGSFDFNDACQYCGYQMTKDD